MNDRLLGNDKKIEYIKKILINFLENAVNIPETKDGNEPEDNLFKLLKESSDEGDFKLNEFYEIKNQIYISKPLDRKKKDEEFKKFKESINSGENNINLRDTVKDQIDVFVNKRFEDKIDIDIKKIFIDFFYDNDMNNWGRWGGSTRDNRQRLSKIITQYLKNSDTLEQLRESRYEAKEESNKNIDVKIAELKLERANLKAEKIKEEVEEKTKLLKQKLSDKTSESEKFKESIMAMSALVKENDLELEKMELRALENENDEARIKIDKINNDINTLVSEQSHEVVEKDTSETLSKLSMGLRKSDSYNKYYKRKEEKKQMEEKKEEIARRRNIRRGKTKRRPLNERSGY